MAGWVDGYVSWCTGMWVDGGKKSGHCRNKYAFISEICMSLCVAVHVCGSVCICIYIYDWR